MPPQPPPDRGPINLLLDMLGFEDGDKQQMAWLPEQGTGVTTVGGGLNSLGKPED